MLLLAGILIAIFGGFGGGERIAGVGTAGPSAEEHGGEFIGALGSARGNLVVRAEPRQDADEVAAVQPGQDLYVVSQTSDGEWSRVEFDLLERAPPELTFGWVETNAIAPVGGDPCGPRVDDWSTAAAPIAVRRECAAGRPLRLVGFLMTAERDSCDASRLYRGDPAWLADGACIRLSTAVGPAVTGFTIDVHIHPDADVAVVLPEPGIPVRVEVIGHFDDPASAECARRPLQPDVPDLVPGEHELWCRQQFVATSIR